MGGKKKYIEMFGSFTEPFIYWLMVNVTEFTARFYVGDSHRRLAEGEVSAASVRTSESLVSSPSSQHQQVSRVVSVVLFYCFLFNLFTL